MKSVGGLLAIASSLVVVLAACSAPGGSNTTGTGTTTPASTSPIASPTPPIASPTVDVSALRAQMRTALMPSSALAIIEGPPSSKSDDPQTYSTTNVCGKSIAPDVSGWHESYGRTWAGDGLYVFSDVHAYSPSTGVEVVKLIESNALSCQEYTVDDYRYRLLKPLTLPSYPGVQAIFAFCQEERGPTQTSKACYSFLARGNVVSATMVVRGDTYETVTNGVILVAGIAAESLRKI